MHEAQQSLYLGLSMWFVMGLTFAFRAVQFQRRPPLLLGVGTLIQLKRWDRLVTLAAGLKKAGHRFRMRIVGDGPLSGTLQQLTRNLQVEDRVSFPGHVNDIPGELRHATCLVHTSEVEGCPNVVVEAMASGRPVVAADAGDIRRFDRARQDWIRGTAGHDAHWNTM
jgi:glycosyltransferase involved in cell wall biosynthesis